MMLNAYCEPSRIMYANNILLQTMNPCWRIPIFDKDVPAQSLGSVQCGHARFFLFTLPSIFRDKLPYSKRIVLVPKSYIAIDLNYLK